MAQPEPITIADVIPSVLERAGRARAQDRVGVDGVAAGAPSTQPPTQPHAPAGDERAGAWAGREAQVGNRLQPARVAYAGRGEPIPRRELAELGRTLRGWHSGSSAVAYRLARFLPRAAVVKMLLEARDSESARNPAAVFMSSLQKAVDPRKGADLEEWVRDNGADLGDDVTEAYLQSFVRDEAERARLAALAAQLREDA